MKNVPTLNAKKDKKKIIKQINDLIKKRNDREEAIDIVLLDGGYFPETDDNYFDFVQSIDSEIIDQSYINIDWVGICEDFNLKSGDISFEQELKVEEALDSINEVINQFINQNQAQH